MIDLGQYIAKIEDLTVILKDVAEHPHGPAVMGVERTKAGEDLVTIAGSHDKARTAWKLIVQDLGYMPQCVAVALSHAASDQLVPDVEAPDPSQSKITADPKALA
jgi:glutamate synthase domain-containing protein 2